MGRRGHEDDQGGRRSHQRCRRQDHRGLPEEKLRQLSSSVDCTTTTSTSNYRPPLPMDGRTPRGGATEEEFAVPASIKCGTWHSPEGQRDAPAKRVSRT